MAQMEQGEAFMHSRYPTTGRVAGFMVTRPTRGPLLSSLFSLGCSRGDKIQMKPSLQLENKSPRESID